MMYDLEACAVVENQTRAAPGRYPSGMGRVRLDRALRGNQSRHSQLASRSFSQSSKAVKSVNSRSRTVNTGCGSRSQ
eukprot:9457915-Heterocapsa_arctica.AAC.1